MPEMVTIPRAEYERLLWAQDYVDRQRARSRRTHARKRASATQLRPVTQTASHRPGAELRPVTQTQSHRPVEDPRPVTQTGSHRPDPLNGDGHRPVTTSSRHRPASRARGGYLFPGVAAAAIEQQQQRAREGPAGDGESDGEVDAEGLWKSPEILAAAARRPGLDLEGLRIRIAVWLQDEAPAGVRLSRKLVLSFIEHWRPPPIDATAVSAKPGDQRIHPNGALVDAHKYDWLQTSHEDRMRRIAALKAAGA
jgi:hypothetical protein